MNQSDVPTAARTLLSKLVEDWSVFERSAQGACAFGGFGPPRGDGIRPKVTVIETVDSYLVRARHADGRTFVAVWVRRPGTGWKLDMAWRGRHQDELTPKRITATQLRAYIADAAPTVREAA